MFAWFSSGDAVRFRRSCLEVWWTQLFFASRKIPLIYDIMLTFACGEERNVKPFAVIAPVGSSGSYIF